MATVASRPVPNRRKTRGDKGSAEDGKSVWSQMLESVATGKRLSEKTLLVLGGTIETQKNYLEALQHDPSQRRRPAERPGTRRSPIANRFALGYTYHDVLEIDQDDVLARLSEYLLVDCHPSFHPLLPPLFTPKTVPDFAITILLDWGDPWNWLRQLRNWIGALRSALDSTDEDVQDALEQNTKAWKQRRKGPKLDTATRSEDTDSAHSTPLGPGEYDEPLGIPLCIVCQNTEKIETLERAHGWGNEQFDTVLIYLRTILLKHGGALIYTASAAPGSLQALTRGMLDIHSLIQRTPLKHHVNDRDKVLVPPNWDSWGKIRPFQEGFPFEEVSQGWSLDIQPPAPGEQSEHDNGRSASEDPLPTGSAIASYESLIRNPKPPSSTSQDDADSSDYTTQDKDTFHTPTNQEFLEKQFPVLENYKAEDEKEAAAKRARDPRRGGVPSGVGGPGGAGGGSGGSSGRGVNGQDAGDARVSEQIGPVQFNVGGIYVEQAIKGIKGRDKEYKEKREREDEVRGDDAEGTGLRGGEPGSGVGSPGVKSPGGTDGEERSNEELKSFFASLASKGGSSAANSPRGGGGQGK